MVKVKFLFGSVHIPLKLVFRLSTLLLVVISVAFGQETNSSPFVPPNGAPFIADNSFLMEEAFNQEAGVIQHINAFTRLWDSKTWAYTFTQEWPFPGHEKHQLSYTLSAVSPDPDAGAGFGDMILNYRYQVCGSAEKRFSFAPRLSMIVPTGNSDLGRGFGSVGAQTNLPFSVYVNRHLITHWNAGATFVPRAKNSSGDRAFSAGYNLGQSFIWLANPRFNVMLETVWNDSAVVIANDQTERSKSLLMSPGVRWAYNFKNGLQIVPGVAVPLGVGPSAGEKGLIVYLSFEHPIGRKAAQ